MSRRRVDARLRCSIRRPRFEHIQEIVSSRKEADDSRLLSFMGGPSIFCGVSCLKLMATITYSFAAGYAAEN